MMPTLMQPQVNGSNLPQYDGVDSGALSLHSPILGDVVDQSAALPVQYPTSSWCFGVDMAVISLRYPLQWDGVDNTFVVLLAHSRDTQGYSGHMVPAVVDDFGDGMEGIGSNSFYQNFNVFPGPDGREHDVSTGQDIYRS